MLYQFNAQQQWENIVYDSIIAESSYYQDI